MGKDSLSLSFSDSLPEDISGMVGEFVEIGIDSAMDDGLLKDIPFVSTAISIYNIGKSIRERHHIAKLKMFVDEFNQGILDDSQREEYREKFRKNERFRNQELQYILLILDRYIEPSKSQMLAKMYLAYLDGRIDWDEFRKYSEIIDRLLPGDCEELTKGNQYDVNHMNVTDSLLRLIAVGFIMEYSKEIEVATTLGNITIPPLSEKNYAITPFGMKFLAIIE